ncbi:hypothetical protein PVAP13_3KG446200 [Panicum virgatum]|uniref:Rx N-terminal domain-containing protein n=1 Tax=Panicum virgatum TaxID=38727 RepID=A0A8T0VD08_PANVG|nr:hypothetical protein PVAP13_3KG446200 [Panicum virgatum]
METVLSAFLGEIAQRSVSFFIGKLSKEATSLPSDENLHRKLLRICIIVEEAEGRQIRNQAMLEQLKVLRAGMYRGYYALLDTFRYRSYKEDEGEDDDEVSHYYSFAISKFNPAKRIQLCGRSSSQGGERELHQVLGSLDVTITDAREFLMFLKDCPPLYHRLYNTYMVLEKCMFGRHAEMEHIINFLMQKCAPGSTGDFGVLPVVGPAKAVRSAFSRIVFFAEGDLEGRIDCVRDGGKVKYQSHASECRDQSVLVVVEVNGDISEATWSSLCSASKRCATNGVIRFIICSRSDEIVRFGTTRALKVENLTQEAFWYFFKALAFGSVDPREEPKLASMAMEIAAYLNCFFIAGNTIARMLRDNLSAKFWRMALTSFREVDRRYRFFIFGAQPANPSENRKMIRRLNGSNEYCSFFNGYHTISSLGEAPTTITVQEVLSGSVVPRGEFHVLGWRSPIPPYHSYTFRCEIHEIADS